MKAALSVSRLSPSVFGSEASASPHGRDAATVFRTRAEGQRGLMQVVRADRERRTGADKCRPWYNEATTYKPKRRQSRVSASERDNLEDGTGPTSTIGRKKHVLKPKESGDEVQPNSSPPRQDARQTHPGRLPTLLNDDRCHHSSSVPHSSTLS